jgi:hypothetical protein
MDSPLRKRLQIPTNNLAGSSEFFIHWPTLNKEASS